MAFLDDIKVSLRISSSEFDSEVEMLVAAAKADMKRVGIREEVVHESNPLVKMAITCYVKAHFGYDNPERTELDSSYRQIVCDLLNSPANSAWS